VLIYEKHLPISIKSLRVDLLFLFLFIGAFYLLWMGSYPLFTPDEGRYSEVAREMIATNDFITPRLNGVGFFDKPILYYWLQASAISMFGLTEWALRFWPVLIGIFGCLVTYVAGHLLFNRKTGLIASIILALHPMYYGASHYANLDLEVAVWISASLLFFIIGIESTSKNRTNFLLLSYFFAALATLTKGLIGIIFPIMIIGAWILILNRFRILTKMRLFLGLTLFFVITMPWYYLVQKANPQFFDFFFVTQQFSRFLTKADFNNKTGVWFYIPLVLAGSVPWTIFLFQSLIKNLQLVWQNRQKYRVELFLLLWLALIFIFFSIPKSKTIGYILPILPSIAILMGRYFDIYWNTATQKTVVALMIFCGLMSCSLISLPFISQFNIDAKFTCPIIFISGMLAFATFVIYFLRKKSLSSIFYCMSLVSFIFLLTLIHSAPLFNEKSSKSLTTFIKSSLQPTDEIVTWYRYYQDLPIYLERRITIVADWHAADIPQYDNWQRELWYNMPYQDTTEWLIEEPAFWERYKSDKRIFIFLQKDMLPHFRDHLQKHAENTAYYVGPASIEHAKLMIISNKPWENN